MLKKPVSLVVLAAAMISVTACGGSSHKATSTVAKHSTSNPAAATTKVPVAPKPVALALTVRKVTAGHPAAYAASVAASVGDTIQFRTTVPGSTGKVSSHTIKVTLRIAQGPATKLSATATSGGQSSKVTISTASHEPLTLQELHYACSLPPASTYCPPLHQSSGRNGYSLGFATTHTTPIFISAMVGPVATKPLPVATTGAVVPPYTVTESLRAVQLGSTKSQTLANSVSAKPGDLVAMATRLSGKLRGAPQTVTIAFDQGPGSSLAVSASVPGGQTSKATVKSSGSSPISIVLPRYTCFVSPSPTFCPAKSIKVLSHKYSISFVASPSKPPVVLLATVQSG